MVCLREQFERGNDFRGRQVHSSIDNADMLFFVRISQMIAIPSEQIKLSNGVANPFRLRKFVPRTA